jgi:hypothetical protein
MTVRLSADPADYAPREDADAHRGAVHLTTSRLLRAVYQDDRPDPMELATPRPWEAQAACWGHPVDVWYPVQSSPWTVTQIGDPYTEARAICATCPAAGACLADAVARDDGYGMHGGLDPAERRELRP